MLIPRRTKFRKQHRPHRTGLSKGGNQIAFGEYGIQALEPAYITNRQIEAARIAMTRHIKRGGKVWIYKGDMTEREFARQQAESSPRGRGGRGERRGGRRADRAQRRSEQQAEQTPATENAAADKGREA